MAPVSKSDSVLDFRHEDGTNWYLLKSRRSGEITWVNENNLPKGFEDQLSRIRRKKGEFARGRVFGEKGGPTRSRKIQLSEAPKVDAGSDHSESSSDYTSSGSSGEETLKKSSGQTVDGNQANAIKGLNKPTEHQSQIVSRLVSTVGCRSLRQMPDVLQSESDVKLNELFANLLYSKPVATWHREIVDLTWTLLLTSPDSTERNRSLEVLCTLASRLGSHDSVVTNSIDELLSEASSEKSEINSHNFSLFTRLCDLEAASRARGVVPEMIAASASDEEMVEQAATARTHATAERFSYLPPGQRELDDEGIIELVYKLYRLKNPEKLLDVPGIIDKYRSQLSVLFSTLLKKYAVDYAELGDSRVFVPIEQKGAKLKSRLTGLFSVYEPSRLVDVDEIIGHYIGRPVEEVAEYLEMLERSYLTVYSQGALGEQIGVAERNEAFGFRDLIREALAVSNPEKLADVDALLRKYRGKEHFVYLAVCDKYNVAVDDSRFKQADALREASVEAERKARMHQVLSGVYEEYNPLKLPEVPKLIEKYPVLELFDLVVKKYNIGLAEKVQLLLSTKVLNEGEIDFTPLIRETVQSLALALEVERRSSIITGNVPTSLLRGFYTQLSDATCVEITVQGKSALYASMGAAGSTAGGSQIEAALRDLVETKVLAALRKQDVEPAVSVRVTAQEPEYFSPDAFVAAETGRVSCVVSLKSDDSDRLASIARAVLEHLSLSDAPQLKSADDQTAEDVSGIASGPGAFRAHSVLRSGGRTSFVGDYRALADKGTEQSPSLYRARLAVWTDVSPETLLGITEMCVSWPRWLRKCAVVLDQGTVSLVGSHKHGAAFRTGLSCLRLGEPVLKLHVPKQLCQRPGMVLAPHVYEWSDVTYHESEDDIDTTVEGPATETVRPLRLTRTTMRDAYLQGLLCMNCDETTHKPPECPIKRKVCWNCHGAHAGAACVLPCRFCKGRHSWGILECVKRGAKRFADWVKSRSYAEEKGLAGMIDDLIGRLRANGWNQTDPAVIAATRTLNQMGVYADLFVEMAKEDDSLQTASVGVDSRLKPVVPSVPAPPLPDSTYQWMERVWLDEILSPALLGRDALKLIMQTKGSALKQLETKENCKIVFKGASAKEIFSQKNPEAPEIDLRFHAMIMCDSPIVALTVKRELRDLIAQVERGIAENTIARPAVVEGFAFLEKVPALNDNIAQFDFLNVNGGAPIELDLKNHFEHIGDLRHWLHQRGVEVELGDDNAVKLPSTSRVIEATDALEKPTIDAAFVEVFNAFFELTSFWTSAPPAAGGPYWFEPYELRPVGLLGLAEASTRGVDRAVFESGQVVCLSLQGAEHFAYLLCKCGFVPEGTDQTAVRDVLLKLRGVVRTVARDNRLLMYMKHPWALGSSSGTVARDVPEEFSEVEAFESVLNYSALRQCGRLGHTEDKFEMVDPDPELIRKMLSEFEAKEGDVASLVPGDHLISRLSLDSVPEGERPYTGYIVDWVTPPEVTDFVSGMGALDALLQDESLLSELAPEIPGLEESLADTAPAVLAPSPAETDLLNALSVADLKEKLKEKGLATTGRKVDLIERIQAEHRSQQQTVPKSLLKCRVELPRALMSWPELANNLSGPGNSHFGHIKQQCPSANLVCLGSASAALVGEARLHVQITASNADDFNKAKTLTEDLVKAVVEVGADICMTDQPASARSAALKEVRIVVINDQQ